MLSILKGHLSDLKNNYKSNSQLFTTPSKKNMTVQSYLQPLLDSNPFSTIWEVATILNFVRFPCFLYNFVTVVSLNNLL